MKILQSDNGPEFVNSILRALTSMYGIDQRLITPYLPRVNGLVERKNKEIGRMVRKGMAGASEAWQQWLPVVQLSLNAAINERTKTSPFTLMFGRKFNEFWDFSQVKESSIVSATIGRQMKHWNGLKEAILLEVALLSRAKHEQQRQHTDASRLQVEPIEVGASVMAIDSTRVSKWDPVYEEPFIVHQQHPKGTYTLKDATGSLLERRRTIDMLKRVGAAPNYKFEEPTHSQSMVVPSGGGSDNSKNKQQDNMKLTILSKPEENEHYIVEKVVNHRQVQGKNEYYVKWKNYKSSDNSWIKEKDFDDFNIIKKYWKIQEAETKKVERPRREAAKRKQTAANKK